MPNPATEATLLRPDNLTSPVRTPWGGRKLANDFKDKTGFRLPEGPLGEAWELSVTPELESHTLAGQPLSQLLEAAPSAYLGHEARLGRTRTALLLKWLDAAQNLSLQIHPVDDDPDLGPDESGKPEAWYVVAHEPHAGLYIGFEQGVGRARVEAALEAQEDLRPLLRFVPVEVGDFVVLDPRTPHAIGAGTCLLEPQLVAPGRHGVTYRYWDWNRRFDAAGRLDPNGEPRRLHVQQALSCTDWERATDAEALRRRSFRAGPAQPRGPAQLQVLAGTAPTAAVTSTGMQVARLQGEGALALPDWDALRALTVIEGEVEVAGLVVPRGFTAVIPACLGPVESRLRQAHALLCACAKATPT